MGRWVLRNRKTESAGYPRERERQRQTDRQTERDIGVGARGGGRVDAGLVD